MYLKCMKISLRIIGRKIKRKIREPKRTQAQMLEIQYK